MPIDRYRKLGRLQEHFNLIAEIGIDTKSYKNIQEESPINGLKCFFDIQFQGNVSSKRLIIQHVNGLWSSTYAL